MTISTRDNKVPIAAISRHRMETDGDGITTLVIFRGCPLNCYYCLNPGTLDTLQQSFDMTLQKLADIVSIDDLYFQATGGGVCFGGGEPLLRANFITDFAKIMPDGWNIWCETSLNVPWKAAEKVLPVAKGFIVDIKDMNPDIYRSYTGKSNEQVISNLEKIAESGQADKTMIRLPFIAGYNTDADRDESERILRNMGYTFFERFDYAIWEKEETTG